MTRSRSFSGKSWASKRFVRSLANDTVPNMAKAQDTTATHDEHDDSFRPSILIPNHNHAGAINELFARLEPFHVPCLMVDDGSSPDVAALLAEQVARHDWVKLIRRPGQGGKGACVMTGLEHLHANGFTHAIQIDADGQHDAGDLPKFLDTARRSPGALVLGTPRFGPDVPKSRLAGRQLSRVLIWLETFSFDIDDPLFGYRVYPLRSTMPIIQHHRVGRRMDFDPEIAVRLKWRGVPVETIPTCVRYPEGGLSNFRMCADNALMVWLHVRLVVALLNRLIPRFKREQY